ncbi:hypothetical protein NPIL_47631 [Nephila pilipes]|uniref:Uncharacterized protein n=1 Tax=Nephila pilipes TaxID=299642 RepID=A0A8X6PAQ4_NEPPI|nr:hypothetical protein NPIL_47631 [Nephila pilipes]
MASRNTKSSESNARLLRESPSLQRKSFSQILHKILQKLRKNSNQKHTNPQSSKRTSSGESLEVGKDTRSKSIEEGRKRKRRNQLSRSRHIFRREKRLQKGEEASERQQVREQFFSARAPEGKRGDAPGLVRGGHPQQSIKSTKYRVQEIYKYKKLLSKK